MSKKEKKFDLHENLIDYEFGFWLPSPCLSGRSVAETGLVTNTSGTSPAPNYGEPQSAESI